MGHRVRQTWFPYPMPEQSFQDAVHVNLGFLISEHGFRIVQAGPQYVRLESTSLCAEATCSPRGEVEVRVFPASEREELWSYTGMVGRATVSRLPEIAADRMRVDNRVLAGDLEYFKELAAEQARHSADWTDYYSGMGPRPSRQQPLP